jgi:hypothetical protein
LEENNLYLKLEKCAFEQHKIEFLGVILEGGTIQMDPSKSKVLPTGLPREPSKMYKPS